jgi:hypothetical protein
MPLNVLYQVPAAAAGFYNKGITASFNYWDFLTATAYLLNPNVAYATAPVHGK